MAEVRDWQPMWDNAARLLKERTGDDLATWNRRVGRRAFADADALRAWLTSVGVEGYPKSLLVMERFGYPDHLTASAQELVDGQYADRPDLRPVYDAVVAAASGLGQVAVQARKTYVSLVTPRRTFARVQAATRTRVDLAFRLAGLEPGGRLRASRIQPTMGVQVGLGLPAEVDEQVLRWLQQAYDENC